MPTDYLTTDTELTSIANAIRTKGGTSAALEYPADFITAINAIPTGGGGSGLTYETGTYTPTTDIAKPTISFTNAHTKKPIFAMFVDATGTYSPTTNTNHIWYYEDHYGFTGEVLYPSTSIYQYARAHYFYRTSNTSTFGTNSTTVLSESEYSTWVSNSAITPGSGSTSRYWRSGRTYKWIAVWGPTT